MRKRNEPVAYVPPVVLPGQTTLPGIDVAPPPVAPPPSPLVPPPPLRMAEGYERIVASVFDMPEPHEEYQRLRTELDLGAVRPSRADYGTVVDALDRAEQNAQRAVELLVNFELAHEAFEMDALVVSGPLREAATQRLEEEKRESFELAKKEMGSKAPSGKQITEADVAAAVASMFPDEWRDVSLRRTEVKGALDAAKSLATRWQERARDLRAMVSTVRG